MKTASTLMQFTFQLCSDPTQHTFFISHSRLPMEIYTKLCLNGEIFPSWKTNPHKKAMKACSAGSCQPSSLQWPKAKKREP